MSDEEDKEKGDFSIATVDQIEVKRVEHVVTNPIFPQGGSEDEEDEEEDDD